MLEVFEDSRAGLEAMLQRICALLCHQVITNRENKSHFDFCEFHYGPDAIEYQTSYKVDTDGRWTALYLADGRVEFRFKDARDAVQFRLANS